MFMARLTLQYLLKLVSPGAILFLAACREAPLYLEGTIFPIYSTALMNGFDFGVSDSKHRCDWLVDLGDCMRLQYPDDLMWGSVYVVIGMVLFPELCEDLSSYKSFSVELRGNSEARLIGVSLEDQSHKSQWTDYITDLDTEWKKYSFSLDNFADLDFTRLRVVFNLTLFGSRAQIIEFRNLKYTKIPVPKHTTDFYPLMMEGEIVSGGKIGCNSSRGNTNWISQENGRWKLAFPANETWATVYLLQQPPLDLSGFDSLRLDMEAADRNEKISIGINDVSGEDPSSISSIEWMVHTVDETSSFPLTYFKDVDLTSICIPVQFVNREYKEKTIYLSSIAFSRKRR